VIGQNELDSCRRRPLTNRTPPTDDDERRSKEVKGVMQHMRRCLPAVAEGEQVLARWADDGWYYQGMHCMLT